MTDQVASKSDLRETELRLTATIEKVRIDLEGENRSARWQDRQA